MKENKLFLIILGYILSFLSSFNIFFLVLNVLVIIFLIIKKKEVKYYFLGIGIVFIRALFINNNYDPNKIDKYLVLNIKENYVILINSKMQHFISYDLQGCNIFSVVKIDGYLQKVKESSNFDVFSFASYLKYKNIQYEVVVDSYEIVFKGDHFKNKIYNFLLTNIDEKSKEMINLLLFGVKENKTFYNNLIKMGVVQMVVVSGFHFNALEEVLSKIKTKWIHYFILIFFLFYLYLLNFQIAASRAFLAYFLRLLGKRYRFFNNYFNFLLILSLFLLLNPFYLFHTGFILSFFLTFVLLFTKELKMKKIYKTLLLYMCALPIIIYMNNEFHLLSILFQFIFTIPITILYFSSWIVMFLKFLSPFYNLACNLFINIVNTLANLDLMIIIKDFNYLELFVYYFALFSICFLLAIKYKKKIIVFNLIIATLFTYKYNYNLFFEEESVVIFDVGQGDSSLISLGNNKGHILIDTGGSFTYDYATKVLIPYFKKNSIRKLDYVIISHDDYDHNGALDSLKRNFKIDKIIDGTKIKELTLNDFKLNNLNYGNSYKEDNEKSGVFLFELFNKSFLIMGDASVEVEDDILSRYNLDIDYLRVGHHGSNTSSSKEFLSNISCNNAFISVGRYNNYGHPHKEVLDNLYSLNYNVYRTDIHGMIIITSNGIKTRFAV